VIKIGKRRKTIDACYKYAQKTLGRCRGGSSEPPAPWLGIAGRGRHFLAGVETPFRVRQRHACWQEMTFPADGLECGGIIGGHVKRDVTVRSRSLGTYTPIRFGTCIEISSANSGKGCAYSYGT